MIAVDLAVAVPAAGVAVAVVLRGIVDHPRTMISHRTAARVQEDLRGRLYDKIAALGPAWFAGERTGSVMPSYSSAFRCAGCASGRSLSP